MKLFRSSKKPEINYTNDDLPDVLNDALKDKLEKAPILTGLPDAVFPSEDQRDIIFNDDKIYHDDYGYSDANPLMFSSLENGEVFLERLALEDGTPLYWLRIGTTLFIRTRFLVPVLEYVYSIFNDDVGYRKMLYLCPFSRDADIIPKGLILNNISDSQRLNKVFDYEKIQPLMAFHDDAVYEDYRWLLSMLKLSREYEEIVSDSIRLKEEASKQGVSESQMRSISRNYSNEYIRLFRKFEEDHHVVLPDPEKEAERLNNEEQRRENARNIISSLKETLDEESKKTSFVGRTKKRIEQREVNSHELMRLQKPEKENYGYVVENPIFTSSISDSERYLKRLRTQNDQSFTWERAGSRSLQNPFSNEPVMVDIYALSVSGLRYVTLFICPYGENNNYTPKGLKLVVDEEYDKSYMHKPVNPGISEEPALRSSPIINYCGNCGAKINSHQKYCGNCGQQITKNDLSNSNSIVVGTSEMDIGALKEGFRLLEGNKWVEANKCFDSVLAQMSDNAYAYLGKAMAKVQVSSFEDLKGEKLEKVKQTRYYYRAKGSAKGALKNRMQSWGD